MAIPAEGGKIVPRPLDQALVLDRIEPGLGLLEGLPAVLLEQLLQQRAGLVGLGDLERGAGFDELAVGALVGFSVRVGEVVVVLSGTGAFG